MLRLREIRKKCNMTMKELGQEIGVAESTISQYETGKRQPDYETLLKLAEYFGVTTDYLLGNEEKAPTLNKKDERDIEFDDFTYAMYNESKNLSDESKAKLIEMAMFFKQQQNKDKR